MIVHSTKNSQQTSAMTGAENAADHIVLMDMENTNKSSSEDGHINMDHMAEVDAVDGRRKKRIPRAVPEVDDEDTDERPLSTDGNTGVDDGFLTPDDISHRPRSNGPTKPRDTSISSFDDERPGYVQINGVWTALPDMNAYQHKKTLAQGMMDLALLSANANQLRYVLETNKKHPYYYSSLIFISMSIFFQVAVGVGLILNGRCDISNKKEVCRANKINNYTVIGIFIVTVVNVFISAFGVADSATS